MARKKIPDFGNTLSDEDVIEVTHPCRYSDVEMRTPRARRSSPIEPRTPSKGPSAKASCLDSPLVTPKLDRKKTKYRSSPSSVSVEVTKPVFVHEDAYRAPDIFVSSGFTQDELETSAEAVREGDPLLRWASVEADEDEQLLRRFDMEAMYGPSVGLTREERWTRASAMGLSPPSEVISALQRNPKSCLSVFDQRLNPDESSSFLAKNC